jgi:uncharacterized protein CbrC (UPF0167 family)
MSHVVICAGCAREMERYEDAGEYRETEDGLCSRCLNDGAAFDRALDAYLDEQAYQFGEEA